MSNGLDLDHDRHSVGLDQCPDLFERLSTDNKSPCLQRFRNFDQEPLILDNGPLQLTKTIKMEAALCCYKGLTEDKIFQYCTCPAG